MSKPLIHEESVIDRKFVLKPPVSRQDLLRYTEEDAKGAEDFLELLREFRGNTPSPPDPA